MPGTPFPGPVDFGSVVAGSGAERGITFRNETSLLLTVPSISVQGADFALLAAAPSGQALQPGQGGEFTIVFTPQTTGARQGSLIIGDRTYPLLGTGVDPPLPKPTVSLDLKQAASAQQGTLIVRFDAPAQTRGTGTATLDFQGAADSAIVFASGGRTVTFAIAPGDVQAALPFQTGTTAGVLTFTVQVGAASDRQSVTIAASRARHQRGSSGAFGRHRWRYRSPALTIPVPSERSPSRSTMQPVIRLRPARFTPMPQRISPDTSPPPIWAAFSCCAPCSP